MDTKELTDRYLRQYPVIGSTGQKLLKKARLLCIGAGGLGCPALDYLTAAGVGHIGIVDGDRVELSNLQRQLLFCENDIGKLKAIAARDHCLQKNSTITISSYPHYLSENNIYDIVTHYDVVLDATDNFETRYLINHVCRQLKKPLISASVHRYTAQIGVFNFQDGPCYQCLYPTTPLNTGNCATAGVVGVTPGFAGVIQASEAIKLITQQGALLSGKVLVVDLLNVSFKTLSLKRNYQCQQQCQYANNTFNTVKLMTPDELASLDQNTIQLIDVRDREEHQAFNIGGTVIPLIELSKACHQLDKTKKTILYCQSGRRSAKACQLLMAQGFADVYSLKEGLA